MNSIIIGTRGSELALAQTRMTLDLLRDSGFDGGLEERIIQTSGDLRQDIKLSDFSKGDSPVAEKGVFTKELEDALLSGEIDAAVHSLKDLPSQLAGEFKLAAVLPRAAVEATGQERPAPGSSRPPCGCPTSRPPRTARSPGPSSCPTTSPPFS